MGRVNIHNLGAAEKALQNYNFKDLQRACLVRGLNFSDMPEMGFFELQSFFIKNFLVETDNTLLDKYDQWFESEMALEGKGVDNPEYSYMFHPSLRMGFYTGEDDEGNLVGSKKPRKFKKPKVEKKRERRKDLGGIFAGTKKAMTMELAKDILTKRYEQNPEEEPNHEKILARIIKKVAKEFPDANEKSIKIWYNKIKKTVKPRS